MIGQAMTGSRIKRLCQIISAQELLICCHLRTIDEDDKKDIVFIEAQTHRDVTYKMIQIDKYIKK